MKNNIKDLINRRLLIRLKELPFHKSRIVEIKIEEISPSGNYILVYFNRHNIGTYAMRHTDYRMWLAVDEFTDNYEIVECLD